MGAVLDHGDIRAAADLHQCIHVGNVAAHVREQQEAGLALLRLAGEIVEIDDEVFRGLDEEGCAACASDGAGHGR